MNLDPTADRLNDLLESALSSGHDHTAVCDGDISFTYDSLNDAATSTAELLVQAGISADEPVLVCVSNSPLDLANYIGVWRAGGVVVPLHESTSDLTARHVLSLTGARLAVGSDASVHKMIGSVFASEEARSAFGSLISIRVATPYSGAILNQAAFVVFTSGTTGVPKGVVQAHGKYCGRLRAIDEVYAMDRNLQMLLYLQLTFSFGQWTSMYTLLRYGCIFIRRRFKADELLGLVSSQSIDWLPVVPSMLRSVIQGVQANNVLAAAVARAGVLQSPRMILCGGEVLPSAVGLQTASIFPQSHITDIYGLTETNSADFILRPGEYNDLVGTIGRPSPGVNYRIRDVDGGKTTREGIGELQVLTPFAMRGYLGDDGATRDAFDDDYLRTGDLARLTQNGSVQIVGRVKELINRGGNKVSPIEIENVYLGNPLVAAAMAVGIPHKILGEQICLRVVLKVGQALELEALVDWGARFLERFKVPDIISIGDSLPQTSTGKADRKRLREQFMEHVTRN